jgi:competence ComEA-like helix-hairpin-helix protein
MTAVWTLRQRQSLGVLVALVAGIFLIERWRMGWYQADPPQDAGPRQAELADRVDPNSAEMSVLAALPGLGATRAAAIVEYRMQYVADGRGTTPFRCAEDLLRVKGIGAALVNNLQDYLVFSPSATTRP